MVKITVVFGQCSGRNTLRLGWGRRPQTIVRQVRFKSIFDWVGSYSATQECDGITTFRLNISFHHRVANRFQGPRGARISCFGASVVACKAFTNMSKGLQSTSS